MKIERLFLFALLSAAISSCETDDVDDALGGPEVTISSSVTAISENGGTAIVSFTLSESSDDLIVVDIAFGGTAIGGGLDYSADADVVTFDAGDLVKNITLTAGEDTLQEGNETIEVSIFNASNVRFDPESFVTITIEDDDVPLETQLIFNEVLYDPPNDAEGDANGDGTRDPLEDEFIEFINNSTQPLDLSGYNIYDATGLENNEPRHTFSQGTQLLPGDAMVVFGGGTPMGAFGGAQVETASSGQLNLTNSGDLVTVTNEAGEVVITFDINGLSGNPDESYTRSPDITGEFVQHASVGDANGALFSPGTKTNGSAF